MKAKCTKDLACRAVAPRRVDGVAATNGNLVSRVVMSVLTRKVVVSVDGLAEQDMQRIRAAAGQGGAEVQFLPEQAHGWADRLRNVDAVFGLPPVSDVEASTVSFLQLHSSGYDPYKTPALLARSNFVIANARGVTAQAVAEHGLAMMFAMARRIPFHVRHQREHIWQRAGSYELLHGSTITIIGMGAIGSALGRMCHAIGMQVYAVQRSAEQPDFVERIFPLDDFAEALRHSQHLALTLPSIGLTRPLIDTEELSQMPQGGYLYNLARSALVDYGALQQSLQNGHLAGAGLDVFPEEPLPASSPLWDMDNVIVSPHAGGRFVGEMSALANLFADNLERFLAGRPLHNVVISADAGEARP